MAFDLIPRHMVAFHGEGILQTKHFHDDIEGGSVHHRIVRPTERSPLFGRRPNPETHDVSKYATHRSDGDIIGIGAEAKSIDRDLSLSSCIFLPP